MTVFSYHLTVTPNLKRSNAVKATPSLNHENSSVYRLTSLGHIVRAFFHSCISNNQVSHSPLTCHHLDVITVFHMSAFYSLFHVNCNTKCLSASTTGLCSRHLSITSHINPPAVAVGSPLPRRHPPRSKPKATLFS